MVISICPLADFFLIAHEHDVHAAAEAVQMTRKTSATNPSMVMKRRILLSSSQLPIRGIAVILSCGESTANVNLKVTKLRFFTWSLGGILVKIFLLRA